LGNWREETGKRWEETKLEMKLETTARTVARLQWCFLRAGFVLGISGNQCLKRHIIIFSAVPKTSVIVPELSQKPSSILVIQTMLLATVRQA
jgi:hypothetical protein